jgi:hypothetical protein
MKAYIARLNAVQACPRVIVGFFFADNRRQLYDLIDECCDADSCEVMELGAGGIYWSNAVAYQIPMDASDTAPGLPADATMTDRWMDALCDEGNWQELDSATSYPANEA